MSLCVLMCPYMSLQVRILNLYNNGIADAGAIVLAKVLGERSSVTWLSLRSNHIADYGLQAHLLR